MGFDSTTAIIRALQPAIAEGVRPKLRRAAMIGNFPPRKCGIATYTRDTFESLRKATPRTEWNLVVMEDPGGNHVYPPQVTHVIPQNDIAIYQKTADDLNRSDVEVVFLQHEFGIFGGDAGSHLLPLLRRLQMPLVTTLHTVLQTPNPDQKRVLDEILRLSSAVIVMTETGADILERVYGAGPTKVHVIPHGAPERPFSATDPFKTSLGLAGNKVIMTFGLLSPNKGLETIIRGLPAILDRHPDAVYLIVGATHPHLVQHEGEAYRDSLIELARSLGVVDHLRFINRFVGDEELVDLLQAADLYVTPYLTEAQVTSGTLAYAIAVGKPVISTPYWHAKEALADGVGVICPFNDTRAFTREIIDLLADDTRRDAMARRAYRAGEPSRWRKVAQETTGLALACMHHARAAPGRRLPSARASQTRRPAPHVRRLRRHAALAFRRARSPPRLLHRRQRPRAQPASPAWPPKARSIPPPCNSASPARPSSTTPGALKPDASATSWPSIAAGSTRAARTIVAPVRSKRCASSPATGRKQTSATGPAI